jgi:hypothetical protein
LKTHDGIDEAIICKSLKLSKKQGCLSKLRIMFRQLNQKYYIGINECNMALKIYSKHPQLRPPAGLDQTVLIAGWS